MAESEIWLRALSLIEDHGDAALSHALKRVNTLLEGGDVKSAAVWTRIAMAIKQMQATDGPVN